MFASKYRERALCAVLAWAAGVGSASAGDLSPIYRHDFDRAGDVAGWDYIKECRLSNPGSGGNPGGYIESACNQPVENGGGIYIAGADTESADFTGNYSDTIWTLSVDLRAVAGDTGTVYLRFRGRNEQGQLINGWRYRLSQSLPTSWTHFEVMFNPEWTDAQANAWGWTYDDAQGFRTLPWEQTLNRAGTAEITSFTDAEVTLGIDNVTLVQVPWDQVPRAIL